MSIPDKFYWASMGFMWGAIATNIHPQLPAFIVVIIIAVMIFLITRRGKK